MGGAGDAAQRGSRIAGGGKQREIAQGGGEQRGRKRAAAGQALVLHWHGLAGKHGAGQGHGGVVVVQVCWVG